MNTQDAVKEFFASSQRPVLFAGAGLSAAAGLPTWANLLKQLSEVAGRDDPLIKQVMKERIHEGNLINAADQFFIAPKLSDHDRYESLKSILKEYDHNQIVCATNLPFSFYITTNYDRSLLDAYASTYKKTPIEANQGDPSLTQAPYETDFFIARIHGRAELPETISLASSHYKDLLNDTSYIDFLQFAFTRSQILFIGFSFLDPAINTILELVSTKVGAYHEGNHIALLPEDADTILIQRLNKLRIRTVSYSSKENHKELWDALCDPNIGTIEPIPDVNKEDPFFTAKKYLSACYARFQLSDKIISLRDATIQGIVSHVIEKHSPEGIDEESIKETIINDLRINESSANALTKEAIESLCSVGHIHCADNLLSISHPLDKHLTAESAIVTLAEATSHRLYVREGISTDKNFIDFAKELLNQLILRRGWDLGAAYAAKKTPDSIELEPLIRELRKIHPLGPDYPTTAIKRSLEDLLTNPSDQESSHLALLGRASFALELASLSPNDTFFHRETLPEIIYLDTNVLMPSIAEGHILYKTYRSSIDNLRESARKSNTNLRIITMHGFLNEIISHRKIAISEMEHFTRDEINDLRRESMIQGTQNLNVYIGAYANSLQHAKELQFSSFIRESAPYHTEGELNTWLSRQGIHTVSTRDAKSANSNYANILHTLEKAYSSNLSSRYKTATLIEHDAAQIAALETDLKNGKRALFVTADRKLTDIIHASEHSHLSNNIISHSGLVQLIELLVGVTNDNRGASNIMWSTRITDEADRIHNYLVSVALDEYHDALNKNVREIIDELSEDAALEINRKNLSLVSKNPEERNRANKIFGVFENRFFEKLRSIMEKQ